MSFRKSFVILTLVLIISLKGLTITGRADETNPPSDPQPQRSIEALVPLDFPSALDEQVVSQLLAAEPNGLITPNVIGGSEVSPENAYPWVASLQFNGHHYCGGTLIAPQWVLTAAHCWVDTYGIVYPIEPEDKVVLGEHHLNVWDEVNQQWIYYISGKEQEIGIAEVHLHPGFNYNTFEFDVALLKLSTPAAINEDVQTIDLVSSTAGSLAGQSSVIVGWGATAYGGPLSDTAQYANISILADSACSNYGTDYKSSSMLCAGTQDGTKDACQGDSGGPLAYQANGAWKLAGIVSWGYECGVPGYPGVYSRVPMASAWIWYIIGADGIGAYDPAQSVFYLRNENSTGYSDLAVHYGNGAAGWIPLVGDWDGNGTDTIGAYDPSQSVFYLRNSNTPGYSDLAVLYGNGAAGWIPLVGDWDGNGIDTVGVYDQNFSRYYLRNTNTPGYSDISFLYGNGAAGWLPLVGDWQ